MKISIIDYNAGNITSVLFALERLGVTPVITDRAEEITGSDKVIFPGVGEASTTMRYLHQKGLQKVIPALRQPVLGICLGMQLMCSYSEEGNTPCLGIFDIKVEKFAPGIKVPHVGWNSIYNLKSPIFKGINENSYVYFVHSYFAPSNPFSVADTDYGSRFCPAINKDNFYATQFHPERSGKTGETILKNFLGL